MWVPGMRPRCFSRAAREYVPASESSALRDDLQAAGIATDLQVVDTDLHGADLRPWTTTAFMNWLHQYADVSHIWLNRAAGPLPMPFSTHVRPMRADDHR